jgi:uncharacterized membrane protein
MDTRTPALSLGRIFVGVAATASGVLQLVTGDFVRLVPKLPAWVPANSAWAYLVGVVLVALGLAIVSDRMTRPAASLLGLMMMLVVAFLYAPTLVWSAGIDRPYLRGFLWTNPLKSLALVGGAAILAGRPGQDRPLVTLVRAFTKLAPLAPWLLSLFLVVCGIQHFVYSDFVTTLVPAWMPEQGFWTYFTGVALMAGGAGLLVPRTARLAASLSALMVFLWVLLLHIPRAVAGPNHPFEAAGVFEALAISGVALLSTARGASPEGPSGNRVPRRSDDFRR